MYYEGDIRPVVKRVRPYKTLLINLPPKSFGFWVLANTQVQACFDKENKNKQKPDDINVTGENEEENFIKTKRSLKRKIRDVHESMNDTESNEGKEKIDLGDNKAFKDGVEQINKDLRESLRRIYFLKSNKTAIKRSAPKDLDEKKLKRTRRQYLDDENEKQTRRRKYNRKLRHSLDNDSFRNRLFEKLSKITKDLNPRFKYNILKRRNTKRNSRVKSKRYSNDEVTTKFPKKYNAAIKQENEELSLENTEVQKEMSLDGNKIRNRRSVSAKKKIKVEEEDSSENEIELDEKESLRLEKILQKLKRLKESPLDLQEKDYKDYEEQESKEGIVLKTKLGSDGAIIDIGEKSNTGILKSTLHEVSTLLANFNKNINRVWAALTVLDL